MYTQRGDQIYMSQSVRYAFTKKKVKIKMLDCNFMGPYLLYPSINYVMKTLRYMVYPFMRYTPHSLFLCCYVWTE